MKQFLRLIIWRMYILSKENLCNYTETSTCFTASNIGFFESEIYIVQNLNLIFENLTKILITKSSN